MELTHENIKLGVSKGGSKFKNDSNPASKFQNKKLYSLALRGTFSKVEK